MAELMVDPAIARGALVGVPWETYLELRQIPEMRNWRMAYLDGTLIIMSPEFLHEGSAELLGMIVRAVASASALDHRSARATTLRLKGETRKKGSGKEPGTSFYIGPSFAAVRGKKTIDPTVDLPPNLAVEVDNKSDSALAPPLYARLGVPEIWIHRTNENIVWFGGLQGPEYSALDRSICLPRLTPDLANQALAAFAEHDENEYTWGLWLQDWARSLPAPPA